MPKSFTKVLNETEISCCLQLKAILIRLESK